MRVREQSGQEYRTRNQAEIGGAAVRYDTISQDWILTDEADNAEVSFYTFSYIRTNVEKKGRPVLFAWNGGPGSSCSQLHLGIMGPTRIGFPEVSEQDPNPPFDLIPNPDSPLDVCDIVMIDPPGTGYARILNDEAAAKYLSVEGDAAAAALVIEAWLLRNERMDCPVYLMGESYGTIRAPHVAAQLMGGPTYGNYRDIAIPVAGTITIGNCGLDTDSILTPDPEQPEESVRNLPVYAATHWYHHIGNGAPLDRAFVEEAYRFSAEEYLPALYLGKAVGEERYNAVAEKLSGYTGIDKQFFLGNRLRLSAKQFEMMCCAKEGKDIGTYDSRYTMPHNSCAGMLDPVADDGAMGMYMPGFASVMNGAKREELGIPAGTRYDQINFAVNGRWEYKSMRTPVQCYAQAMRRNPKFRMFLGSGYYDLCTVFPYVSFVMGKGKLDASRVTVRNYEGGHVLYMGRENARAFGQDIRKFILGEQCE